jgi:hypothetical protein
VEKYRRTVERVVTEIGEHPEYEMKRACSLQSLPEKLELVKDIQSIATSRIDTEKYLVIGADEKLRAFCPISNANDFDEARIRQMLDKYLSPIPAFEVFHLESSGGCRFILFVIPKQRRTIVARVTVSTDDPKDMKPRLLLREGDLWTKGASTGKRLAKAEDWDEIYEEIIEAEAEQRAKVRTTHVVELAIAREKVKPAGSSLLPSVFTDEEFQALVEELCSRKDEARLRVLLERLRDDAVEAWNAIGGYEAFFITTADSVSESAQKVREHVKNILRPTMHWLTLLAIYTVKNNGPISFLDAVVDLLREVFETTHRLQMPRSIVARGQHSRSIDEHISHTAPALESLIALHLIGAYIAKRARFEYLRSLLTADVYHSSWEQGTESKKRPMVFWPIDPLYGEPEDLGKWGGRLRLCTGKVLADSSLHKLFGTENATLDALAQYEFCLELNSFVTFPKLSPETGKAITQTYPNMAFDFRPDFLAFPLSPVHALAAALFREVKHCKPQLLKAILFDQSIVPALTKPGAVTVFADFLDSIAQEHANVYLAQHRFTPISSTWPKQIGDELKQIREAKKQPAKT